MEKRLLLSICLFLFSAYSFAGNFKGKVSDTKTGEPLIGSAVTISNDSSHKSTITGLDGSFEITDLPEGNYTLAISDFAYNPFSQEIAIGAGNTDSVLAFQMATTTKDLKEVVVIGNGRNNGSSDAGARKLEKASDNVLNILSSHQIQLMPDVTVANVLRRMPGVTVDRGADGEGRYPVIRGMDKRYNYTLVNGIKIPSPDDKNRYVPMDIFPSEMLQRLEVIKSLTPDMEGDAIGGVMNMVLRDAPDRLMVNAQAALGYSQMVLNQPFSNFNHGAVNQKSPGEIYGANYATTAANFSTQNLVFTSGHPLPNGQLGFTVGDRFLNNKLGAIVSASLQSTDRMSTDQFFVSSPQPNPILNSSQPDITDEQNRMYSIHNDRLGAHAKLDYRINDKNHISFYTVFMQLNNYESRNIIDTSGSGMRTGLGTGVLDYEYRSQTNLQSIYNATLQGQHSVGSHLSIDWSAVYSHAGQKTPDRADLTTETTITKADSAAPAPVLSGLERVWQHNSDQDIAGYLNIHYKFDLNGQKFDIGLGGMARHKERNNYYNEYDFNPLTGSNIAYTNFNNDGQYFQPIYPAGTPQSLNSYSATENISAEYVEARWIPNNHWNILGGVRFENTSQSYNQYQLPITANAKTGTVSYIDPLPSLQVKYKLNDKSALHLAYFSSISRPGFFEIVPTSLVTEYYTENGNPSLKHVKAQNIDFRYELFPGGANQLLLGVFYKNIQNPIEYVYARPATSESVIEPENVGTAHNVGAEFVYTHYFNKFGISANYTYTHSDITTSYKYYYANGGGDTAVYINRTRPLQGQAAHVGNLSLLYKDPKSGIELQLAAIYTGRHIVYLSQYATPDNSFDYWQRGTTILDFSGEKQLGKHFSVYVKLNNLLNTPDIVEIIAPSTYLQTGWTDQTRSDRILVEKKKYGQSYLVGLRYHL